MTAEETPERKKGIGELHYRLYDWVLKLSEHPHAQTALFLVALFFYPVIQMVGNYLPITAPALVIVGSMMMWNVTKIAWSDFTEAMPAFLVVIGIPFNQVNIAGLLVVVLAGVHAAFEGEVKLLSKHLASARVGLHIVLLSIVVEIDLLAGQNLNSGAAFIRGCKEFPYIGLVVVVKVIGGDLLALGRAQGGIHSGHSETLGVADASHGL